MSLRLQSGESNNFNMGFRYFFMPNQALDQQSPIVDSDGVYSNARETMTQKTSTKKRKAVGEMDDDLVEIFRKMHDATNDRLQCLVSRIYMSLTSLKLVNKCLILSKLCLGYQLVNHLLCVDLY